MNEAHIMRTVQSQSMVAQRMKMIVPIMEQERGKLLLEEIGVSWLWQKSPMRASAAEPRHLLHSQRSDCRGLGR